MLTNGRECKNVHCEYRDEDFEYSCKKISDEPTIDTCPDRIVRLAVRVRTIKEKDE